MLDFKETLINSPLPRLWLLFGTTHGDNAQLLNLAKSLEWPFEVKGGIDDVPMTVVDRVFQTSGVLLNRKKPLLSGLLWPDLVLISGGRRVVDALRIKALSGGRSRIVCVGRPWANLDLFDLVVTTPQYRLPDRPNILQNSMPLNPPAKVALRKAADAWRREFEALPRPWTAMMVGGNSGSCRFSESSAEELAKQGCDHVRRHGGSLLISTSARTPKPAADRLMNHIDVPHLAYHWGAAGQSNPYLGFLALADDFIVTSDSASMIAEAVATEKPVALFDMPLKKRAKLLTRRPTNRHWLKLRDALTIRGLWFPARDMVAYQQQLRAEGYLNSIDRSNLASRAQPFRSKKPGDLERAITAIHDLFPRLKQTLETTRNREPHGLAFTP